jgi:hypothetical protein
MDVYLADEQAFHYIPRFSLDVAQDRIEQKKTQLIAGTVGALLARPKPEEIQMVSVENRLEPFWLITISTHTAFDRNRTFTFPVTGPEVHQVTILGQDLAVDNAKEGPRLVLNGVEHCVDDTRACRTFDGLSGTRVDMNKYLSYPKTLIVDLEQFSPSDTVVIPPQVRASAVVRQVMSEVIRPVQQAHTIHEERVDVEAIELNFRPVYALEYEWIAKGKRGVVEFDGLTGEINGGGRKLSDHVKGLISHDLLFDVTADAVGLVVPGGSIAVKLVKAVVDRGKK